MVTNTPPTTTVCDDRWSAGARWLAESTSHPTDVLSAWSSGTLATIHVPDAWSVAEACLLDSLDALPLLSRARRLGPVLAYPERELAWWLVPPTAADHLAGLAPRIVLREAGWQMRCPAPGDYSQGAGWLEKPTGSGELSDPVTLGAALSRPQTPGRSR